MTDISYHDFTPRFKTLRYELIEKHGHVFEVYYSDFGDSSVEVFLLDSDDCEFAKDSGYLDVAMKAIAERNTSTTEEPDAPHQGGLVFERNPGKLGAVVISYTVSGFPDDFMDGTILDAGIALERNDINTTEYHMHVCGTTIRGNTIELVIDRGERLANDARFEVEYDALVELLAIEWMKASGHQIALEMEQAKRAASWLTLTTVPLLPAGEQVEAAPVELSANLSVNQAWSIVRTLKHNDRVPVGNSIIYVNREGRLFAQTNSVRTRIHNRQVVRMPETRTTKLGVNVALTVPQDATFEFKAFWQTVKAS